MNYKVAKKVLLRMSKKEAVTMIIVKNGSTIKVVSSVKTMNTFLHNLWNLTFPEFATMLQS
jgi:hypothetical protein